MTITETFVMLIVFVAAMFFSYHLGFKDGTRGGVRIIVKDPDEEDEDA